MLKRVSGLFTTAYLMIIFCIYPFYMQNGYQDMGEAKNRFFFYVSIAAAGIMGVCSILHLLTRLWSKEPDRTPYLVDWERVSITDLLVLIYGTMVFLSYVLSKNKDEALWGTEGWYIGCVLLLLLCFLYFFISRLWDGNIKILYFLSVASAVVFLLGIGNRFSFYPVFLKGEFPEFISTLGNINWYCGYLSVTAPIGIGMFLLSDELSASKGKKWMWGIYGVITFLTAFSQGSDSIFLWFAALFFFFLWISLGKKERFKNWILLVILWGISAQTIRIMRHVPVGKYNYESNNLCGYFTDSSLPLWILLAAVVFYGIMIRVKNFTSSKIIKRGLLILPLSVCGLWCLLMVIHTVYGIPWIRESEVWQKIFLFDRNWGHGRGAAYITGVHIFGKLPLIHKLLGAGPDCFSKCAYSMPELSAMLYESFGNARLTNAHNELLTNLVNLGIFGVCSYVGIFIFFVGKCMKKGRENPILYLFGASIICYFAHNMVSFAHVLNLPFLFLFLGMGEKICREY